MNVLNTCPAIPGKEYCCRVSKLQTALIECEQRDQRGERLYYSVQIIRNTILMNVLIIRQCSEL